MQADRKDARAFAMLGLVMLLWAGNAIVGRAVRFEIPPLTLAFVRWTGALIAVSPFAVMAIRRDWPAIRRAWRPILLLGLLGVAGFNALLYTGLRHTPAANALLLQAAIPALVVLLDRAIFGSRPPLWQTIGVALSTFGVLAIVFQGDVAAALELRFGTGDTIILAAVVVWSLYTVLLRLRPPIAPVSFIAVTFAIGALAMAPLALGEWSSGRTVVWSTEVAAAFAYVALLPSLVAYFIYNWAAGRLGAARTGQALTLMPVFGALLSAGLLDERLYTYHLAGMALIVAGIVLGALSIRSKDSAGAAKGPPLEDRP